MQLLVGRDAAAFELSHELLHRLDVKRLAVRRRQDASASAARLLQRIEILAGGDVAADDGVVNLARQVLEAVASLVSLVAYAVSELVDRLRRSGLLRWRGAAVRPGRRLYQLS